MLVLKYYKPYYVTNIKHIYLYFITMQLDTEQIKLLIFQLDNDLFNIKISSKLRYASFLLKKNYKDYGKI